MALPVHAEGYYSIAGAEAPQPSPTIRQGGLYGNSSSGSEGSYPLPP